MTTSLQPIGGGGAHRSALLRRFAASLMAGAAVIHLGVAADHFSQWVLAGVYFVVIGVGQLAWAVWVWSTPVRRVVLAAGIGVNAAVIAVWLMSRTVGLPVGPDAGGTEAIGVADGLAVVLQLGCITLATALLPRVLGDPRYAAPLADAGGTGSSPLTRLTTGTAIVVLLASGASLASTDDDDSDRPATPGPGLISAEGTPARAVNSSPDNRRNLTNLPKVQGATAAQREAAVKFLEATIHDTLKYRDSEVAENAGFDVSAAWDRFLDTSKRAGRRVNLAKPHVLHVVNNKFRTDGRILDASAPETLLYAHLPDDDYELVGVMFTTESKVRPVNPKYQPYMRWYFYENCVPIGDREAGPPNADPVNEQCPDGTRLHRTGYQSHVWFVDSKDLVYAFALNAPMKQLAARDPALR